MVPATNTLHTTGFALCRARTALFLCLLAGWAPWIAHAAEPSPPPPKPKELKLWVIWRDRGLDAACRRFEQEYPGWKIQSSFTLPLTLGGQQKLLTAIAGGDPPDVLIFDRFYVGEWVVRGALACQQDQVNASVLLEDQAEAVASALESGRPREALHPLAAVVAKMKKFPGCRIETLGHDLRRGIESGAPTSDTLPQARTLRTLCDGIRQDAFYDTCWKEGSYEGRVYSIPQTTDSRALLYNEDLLEKAGFVDENGHARPPRDWDELKEYAVKLTEYDSAGNITQLGFAPNYGNSWLYLFGWLNGGNFMSADGRTCTLDDPPIVQALTYMRSVYDALGGFEKVDVFRARPFTGGYDLFTKGKIALVINTDMSLRFIADLEPNLRFGTAPPPSPKGRQPLTWSGGFCWAIPRGAKHPDAAFEFIRFLNTERMWIYQAEVNARFFSSRGRVYIPMMAPLPAVNAKINEMLIAHNPNVPPRVQQGYQVFLDILKISRFRPVTGVGGLLWDEHVRAYDKAVRHTLEPKEALERGRRTVQAQLDMIFRNRARSRVNWGWVMAAFVALAVLAAFAVYWFGGRRALVRRILKPESRAAYLFAAPWLLGLAIFTVGPVLASLVYSVSRYDILSPAQWVGPENYLRLLGDQLFWKSLLNTAYMMIGVPLTMAVGLLIALLLNMEVRGVKLYRTLFYFPAIVPLVANAILWIWVLDPTNGLLNSFLRILGFLSRPAWLYSSSWGLGSKAGLMVMGLWGAGAGMIIWLAGLKGIPAYLYEAAEIDGAGPVRRFFNVTLPMLSPYIFFNLVMGIILTMQIFTPAYIMTAGGPDDSSLFFVYYLFNQAFLYLNMGYASAMAWILMVVICLLTLVQLKLATRWVHYESE